MSWEVYKGLDLPSSPTGDAGINLKDDLKLLADRDLSNSAVPGSVLFVGGTSGSPVLAEDVGMFCWDSTNNRLGIGTSTPQEQVQIQGNGKGLLMATGGSGETETFIYFGSGLSATGQWQRIKYVFVTSDLTFERKDSATGLWSAIMTLDWQKSRVGIGTVTPTTMLHVGGPITVGAPPTPASEFPNPPTGQVQLYVEFVGSVPTLKARFEDGTVRTLASGV